MSWAQPVSRGQILRVEIGLSEPKLVVVVSNNSRNRKLSAVLVARMTTSPKPSIPSIVPLADQGGFVGSVVCDDIFEVFEDEVLAVVGSLAPATVSSVNAGLQVALGLA